MAELVVNPGSELPQRIKLARVKTTIGRSARNDICIPDAFASRLHAEVREEGDGFWLCDMGSANGTRLNGQQVSASVRLSNGDEIKIGENLIVFLEDEKQAQPSSALLTSDTTGSLDPAATISFSFKVQTEELLSSQVSTRNDLLALISKVGIALLSSSGLQETLDQVAKLVFDAVPAERCVIMLKDERSDGGMSVASARVRGREEPPETVRISSLVLGEVMTKRNSVLTSDAQHDPRYASQTIALQGIRSVLAVPLTVDGDHVFGIVYADSPIASSTFGEEHLNILTTLASVAAIRVENARLLEARLEQERYERELALATEIQQRFQPSTQPSVPGYEFQGVSFSCYEIGGDYYDFIQRDGGRRIVIALGDVSGKGTAAALLMSSLHAAIHAQVAAEQPLLGIPGRVNSYLVENTPANRFVTLFLGELDPSDGSIEFVNAGHNPPLLGRVGGEVVELPSGGLPLGLLAATDYEGAKVHMEPGDVLVIYSDGVTEAMNVEGEEFGTQRLIEVIRESASGSASEVRDRIESAVSAFTTTAQTTDDITIVIVKRRT